MATIYLNDTTIGELRDRGVNPSKICNKLAKEYLRNDFEYNKRIALVEFNASLEKLRQFYIVEAKISDPKK